jgi:hypothetical protein
MLFMATQMAVLGLLFSPALAGPGSASSRPWSWVKAALFALLAAVTVAVGIFNVTGRNAGVTARVTAAKTLSQEISAGTPFGLRLDEEACDIFNLGGLICGVNYEGRYDPETRKWTFTGLSKFDKGVITAGFALTRYEPSTFTVWGMLFGFGDDGIVMYMHQGVGQIWLRGDGIKPVTVRGGHFNGDPGAHAPDSHAIITTGIPKRTLPSPSIHEQSR